MNKRIVEKLKKQAETKIIDELPLSQMERIAQNKMMERWLGPEIKRRIRTLGKAE